MTERAATASFSRSTNSFEIQNHYAIRRAVRWSSFTADNHVSLEDKCHFEVQRFVSSRNFTRCRTNLCFSSGKASTDNEKIFNVHLQLWREKWKKFSVGNYGTCMNFSALVHKMKVKMFNFWSSWQFSRLRRVETHSRSSNCISFNSPQKNTSILRWRLTRLHATLESCSQRWQ